MGINSDKNAQTYIITAKYENGTVIQKIRKKYTKLNIRNVYGYETNSCLSFFKFM